MSRVEGWPPRWVTATTAVERRHGDGGSVAEFVNAYCRITKDSVAGRTGAPILLRPWQAELLTGLFARRKDGRRRHRQALIGMPRKNGKSALSSGIALYGLFCEADGAEVYACAGEKDQARIVFGMAKRMVELDPELSGLCKPYRDAIEVPSSGSVFRVLSAEAYSKEGLSPTLVVFDEVHVQPNDDLWNVMALGSGARVDPLVLGITTAGARFDSSGRDSLCFQLYQYGQQIVTKEVDDPSFFFAWWEPKAGIKCDHTDPRVWREANPGFDDLIDEEDFASTVLRTPEGEFRTKRTNVWVTSHETWLPQGFWDRCADKTGAIPDGSEVVLGFDGSFSNDSTALVVCTPSGFVDVVEAWERPNTAGNDWRVPVIDVEEAIRIACKRWQVREIVCDPFRWARTYQILESERLPIVEYPQSPQRMVPATQRFYEAVANRTLTHSGDPRLARHVGNCFLKVDARGSRLDKERRNSPRKIDLAVAAVMAFDRAVQLKPKRRTRVISLANVEA